MGTYADTDDPGPSCGWRYRCCGSSSPNRARGSAAMSNTPSRAWVMEDLDDREQCYYASGSGSSYPTLGASNCFQYSAGTSSSSAWSCFSSGTLVEPTPDKLEMGPTATPRSRNYSSQARSIRGNWRISHSSSSASCSTSTVDSSRCRCESFHLSGQSQQQHRRLTKRRRAGPTYALGDDEEGEDHRGSATSIQKKTSRSKNKATRISRRKAVSTTAAFGMAMTAMLVCAPAAVAASASGNLSPSTSAASISVQWQVRGANLPGSAAAADAAGGQGIRKRSGRGLLSPLRLGNLGNAKSTRSSWTSRSEEEEEVDSRMDSIWHAARVFSGVDEHDEVVRRDAGAQMVRWDEENAKAIAARQAPSPSDTNPSATPTTPPASAATTTTAKPRQVASIGRTSNIVDLIICIASIIGSMIIIIPYTLNRRQRKLRHALILGLATSDLAAATIIVATTSYLLDDKELGENHRFCDAAGFLLAVSIFTQHLWNLAIGIITYMILVHPLSRITLGVERRIVWLWPTFWLLGAIVHIPPWAIYGWADVGGYCAINAPAGNLTGTLIQFIPRATVFVVLLALYARLFFFLRRTNFFSKIASSARHRFSVSSPRVGGPPADSDIAAALGSAQQDPAQWEKHQGERRGSAPILGKGRRISLRAALRHSLSFASCPPDRSLVEEDAKWQRDEHAAASGQPVFSGTGSVPGVSSILLPSNASKTNSTSDNGGSAANALNASPAETTKTSGAEGAQRKGSGTSASAYSNTNATPPQSQAKHRDSDGTTLVTLAGGAPAARAGGNGGLPLMPGGTSGSLGRSSTSPSASPTKKSPPSTIDVETTDDQDRVVVEDISKTAKFADESVVGDSGAGAAGGGGKGLLRGVRAWFSGNRSASSNSSTPRPSRHVSPLETTTSQDSRGTAMRRKKVDNIPLSPISLHAADEKNGDDVDQLGMTFVTGQELLQSSPSTGSISRANRPADLRLAVSDATEADDSAPSSGKVLDLDSRGAKMDMSSFQGWRGLAYSDSNQHTRSTDLATSPTARAPSTSLGPSQVLDASASQLEEGRANQAHGEEENEDSDTESSEMPHPDPFASFRPMSPRKDARDFQMTSPPQEHLNHRTASRRASAMAAGPSSSLNAAAAHDGAGVADAGRGAARASSPKNSKADAILGVERGATGSFGRAGSALGRKNDLVAPGSPATVQTHEYEFGFGENFTWGQNVGGSVSQQQQPAQVQQLRRGSRLASGNGQVTSGLSSGGDSNSMNEPVDAIGTTLNRQASVLMLLYPLAYCLLFSISIIRIITDLASPNTSRSAQRDALHSISRWFIFAQGALDAIIFQFIEKQFRKRMKRRRKKALGEEVGLTAWQKISRAIGDAFGTRHDSRHA